MPRTRLGRGIAALLLAVFVAAPLPAAAVQFIPIWVLSGWTFGRALGNVDGDLRDELLFSNNADGHLAVVDGATGAIEKFLMDARHCASPAVRTPLQE